MCPDPYALLISLIDGSFTRMVKLFDSSPLGGRKIKIRVYGRNRFTFTVLTLDSSQAPVRLLDRLRLLERCAFGLLYSLEI